MTPTDTTADQRYQMLRSTEWGTGLDEGDLRALAAVGKSYEAASGARIVVEDSHDRWMGVLVSGELEVVRRQIANDEKLLRVIGPGRAFGELSMLDAEKRSASIDTLMPVTLLRWEPADLDALAATDAAVAYRLVLRMARDLSRRFRTKDHQPDY